MNEDDPMPLRESPLILASASPRRRELLESVGVPIEVRTVDVDESPLAGEDGRTLALRLARAKAHAAMAAWPGRTVLAADTVVATGSEILGKPRDAHDARRMLTRLSGSWHAVVTGVALGTSAGTIHAEHSLTRVRFATLAPEEIDRYVAGAEPYDKAGGYALQGAAGWFVEEIQGSASNVIGLPLEVVRRLFLATGMPAPALEG
jgi:septum formation protein